MKFIRTNNTDTRFVKLCSMLDQYLISVIGEKKQQKEYNKHNVLADIENVILLVDGEKSIGCAGLKRIDTTTAEVKRVFIADEFRHHGYGRKMISEIEHLAKNKGYKILLLETGVPMKSAWEFYASCGFSLIENYGPYAGMDSSVCMKKNIENYLETERLILRPIKDSDARDTFEYCKNPNVGPAAGWEPHKNIEDTRRIMKEIFIGKENIFGIVLKSSGKIIGSIGLHTDPHRRHNPRALMLGYAMSECCWGKGLMTEAARAIIEYGFRELPIDLISCTCYSFNSRSRRVIQKCGFEYEGCLRQAAKRYDGKILDVECYSLLNKNENSGN
jgi:putative acetyltransferase